MIEAIYIGGFIERIAVLAASDGLKIQTWVKYHPRIKWHLKSHYSGLFCIGVFWFLPAFFRFHLVGRNW